jgi:hypothetical protein
LIFKASLGGCMDETTKKKELLLIAEKIKAECLNAALEEYATALGDGLCCEGAWECAVEAIRNLNITKIINGEKSSQKYI